MSGRAGVDDRGAEGAEWGEVWKGVFPLHPTTGYGGSGGASWAPPVGSGAKPPPLSHFLHILCHRKLLVARKIQFSFPKYRPNEKIGIFLVIGHRRPCSLRLRNLKSNKKSGVIQRNNFFLLPYQNQQCVLYYATLTPESDSASDTVRK